MWHWFFGTGIIIMGGVNVFLGMALYHKYTDYGIQVSKRPLIRTMLNHLHLLFAQDGLEREKVFRAEVQS